MRFPFPTRFPASALSRLNRYSPLRPIASYIASRSPGDRAIAGALVALIAFTSLIGTLAYLRAFQIVVPAYGGTLNEGVAGSPRFPNPVLAVSDVDRDIVALTYAGLMGYDGAGRFVPVLAESVERSPDGTVYTFILRESAQFSDGTPVTADDVVFTVGLVQDPAVKSPLLAQWNGVRAEAIDSRTVQFTLPQAYAGFIEETALGILPRHLWENVEAIEVPFHRYTAEPVGAGPFTLEAVTRRGDGSVGSYRFDASDNYALGRPYLDSLTLTFFNDQAALRQAITEGNVESGYGAPGTQVVSAPYERVFGVFFNGAAYAPLDEQGVRRALSLAIDRERIIDDIFSGYATAINGPFPPGTDLPQVPLPDPSTRQEDAGQALVAAGWTFDAETGRWSKDGEELAITLVTSSAPELRAVAAQVAADWQAIGVPTELTFYAPGELGPEVIRPRTYQALLFGQVVRGLPDLYAFWSSTEQTGAGLNITRFSSTEADTLLRSLRTGTAEDPAAAAARAQELITADSPAAFLYTPDFLYAIPDGLYGVTPGRIGAASDRFRGVHSWHRYREFVWPAFADGRVR